mmetsp:Transcript_71932/g.227187  ORF Transcript_71932/g.227187 Transcript_71932/m.227187 type:complete len:213 (-) Transcript_71932:40-678(-)
MHVSSGAACPCTGRRRVGQVLLRAHCPRGARDVRRCREVAQEVPAHGREEEGGEGVVPEARCEVGGALGVRQGGLQERPPGEALPFDHVHVPDDRMPVEEVAVALPEPLCHLHHRGVVGGGREVPGEKPEGSGERWIIHGAPAPLLERGKDVCLHLPLPLDEQGLGRVKDGGAGLAMRGGGRSPNPCASRSCEVVHTRHKHDHNDRREDQHP